MSNDGQLPGQQKGGRAVAPDATQVFSTSALRRFAVELDDASGGISVQVPVLEGRSPGLEGRRFALRPGRHTIGRRADNAIVIDDGSVSGSHAWITNQQGSCVIMNTLSTNGTFVNDQRVHEVTLRHGDHVRLGQAEFVFLTREHDQPEPASRRRIAVAVLLAAVVAVAALAWWLRGSP